MKGYYFKIHVRTGLFAAASYQTVLEDMSHSDHRAVRLHHLSGGLYTAKSAGYQTEYRLLSARKGLWAGVFLSLFGAAV